MKPKFGIRTVLIPILAIITFFVIQIAVSIVYLVVLMFSQAFSGGQWDPSKIEPFLSDSADLLLAHSNTIGMLYSVILIALAILALRGLSRSNPLAVRRQRPDKGQWIAAVLTVIGAAGLVTLLMLGIQELAKSVPVIQNAMDDYLKLSEGFIGSGNIPMVIVSTCILVPISEDLVFRGIIQGELRRVLPGWAAILIQGVVFALVHGDPIQISYVLIPAMFLGIVYEWTQSIYVPIAMHMIFNFVGSALPLMFLENETASGILVIAEFAMIPVAAVAMVFLYKKRNAGLPDPATAANSAQAAATAGTFPEIPDAGWKHRDHL